MAAIFKQAQNGWLDPTDIVHVLLLHSVLGVPVSSEAPDLPAGESIGSLGAGADLSCILVSSIAAEPPIGVTCKQEGAFSCSTSSR